jgi:hypothetical protein
MNPAAFSQEVLPEYVIDVSAGHFILGEYYFLLENVAAPISIGVIDGNVLVEIQTAEGIETLSLGEGSLSLTERAVPYVTILEAAEGSVFSLGQYDACAVCGRSTGIGNHQRLKCGHYGCLVSIEHLRICSSCAGFECSSKDHSRCPHCKVRMCIHENIKCEYMRNPAPTPYTTRVPGEGMQYYSISEDRTRVDGALEVGPRTTPWSPGEEFVRTPPPSPSPTPPFDCE